jgi:ATP-dependent helicase Lhr and Lhr-like helicase
MRANDLLAAAFPQVLACNETRPPGDIPVPLDHPIVAQTVEDCLTEAMDVDGFLDVLRGLRDGSIERRSVDLAEPSAFSRGILSAQPYAFLDDAPLEERRTQAVLSRRFADVRTVDGLGDFDPEAVQRVRDEAWPRPADAEETHEALLWMGYVESGEAASWTGWLSELSAAGRVVREGERWYAVEASRDPKAILRGRMEALGPVESDDPLLLALEAEGVVLRTRIAGRPAWCDRRLLARIHRYTVDRLRREIEPVTASQFLRFLGRWQRASADHQREGPRGVCDAIAQLAGFEVAAGAWEKSVLPARVSGYKREWLDQATLSGEVVWARLWGAGAAPMRNTPIALVPREDLDAWTNLPGPEVPKDLSEEARGVFEALDGRGAMFLQEIVRTTRLPLAFVEDGLASLVGRGLATGDSFAGLRFLISPAWRRRGGGITAGRWSLLRRNPQAETAPESAEFVARRLLARTGIVFRKTLARERQPVPWRDIARACRALEARGEVRGGRFVEGFDGEQYALPEAVALLREMRRRGEAADFPLIVSAADPLNFQGILTPEERVAPTIRGKVRVA